MIFFLTLVNYHDKIYESHKNGEWSNVLYINNITDFKFCFGRNDRFVYSLRKLLPPAIRQKCSNIYSNYQKNQTTGLYETIRQFLFSFVEKLYLKGKKYLLSNNVD